MHSSHHSAVSVDRRVLQVSEVAEWEEPLLPGTGKTRSLMGKKTPNISALLDSRYAEVEGGGLKCLEVLSDRTAGATYRAADQGRRGMDVPANRIAWLQRRASKVWAKLTSAQFSSKLLQGCRDYRLQYAEHHAHSHPRRHRGTWDSFVCFVVGLEASQKSTMWSRTQLLPNTRHRGRHRLGAPGNLRVSRHCLVHSVTPLPYLTASLSPNNEAADVRCRKTTHDERYPGRGILRHVLLD